MYFAPDRCIHTYIHSRSILLHPHHRHFRAGYDGTRVLQRCVGGFESRTGRVVDLGHGGDLLVFHVGDGVRGDGDLGVLLVGFLVRACIERQEEEQIRG